MNIYSKISIVITFVFSFISLTISIKTCSDSQRFSEINAEVQWNTLLESYQNIDNEIRRWEESKGMKRDGDILINKIELDLYIEKLKTDFGASGHIIRLYRDRSDRYDSLLNVAKRYKVVYNRLRNIDFRLPTPPRKSGFPYTFPFKLK